MADTDWGGPGPHPTGREPVRILVVDDDPQTLYYVRNTLTEAGFEALVTGDYNELPDIIRTAHPALVLLDLMLPGTDGIELMERTPALADLPVIFISGYRREETIARALDSAAADYIVKPFSPTELTARIRAALRRWAAPDPYPGRKDYPAGMSSSDPIIHSFGCSMTRLMNALSFCSSRLNSPCEYRLGLTVRRIREVAASRAEQVSA